MFLYRFFSKDDVQENALSMEIQQDFVCHFFHHMPLAKYDDFQLLLASL